MPLLSIGHTSASYQNYSGDYRQAYFHHGLDIRANAGQEVFASAGGKVVNIEDYGAFVEIMPGVEDMQVQFGIDASGVSGVATRYVNPNAVPARLRS